MSIKHESEKNEINSIAMSLICFPFMVLIRFIMGYRSLLYVDLFLLVMIVLFLLVFFFIKDRTSLMDKIIKTIFVFLTLFCALFGSATHSNRTIEFFGYVTYIFPLVLAWTIHYFKYKRKEYKEVVQRDLKED